MLTQTSGVDVTATAAEACGCLKLATEGDCFRTLRRPIPAVAPDPRFDEDEEDEDEEDAVAGDSEVVGSERREGGASVEARGRFWDLELDLLPFVASGSVLRLISSFSVEF
jgi:hypothetical protein